MGAIVPNIAKGALAYYVALPGTGDVLRWMLLQATWDLPGDDNSALDCNDVAAVIALCTGEASFDGYTAKGLATSTVAATPNDTNNTMEVSEPTDPSWNPTTAQDLAKIMLYYDPTGSSAYNACIPLFLDDFVLTTPTSGSITYQPADPFFTAAASA